MNLFKLKLELLPQKTIQAHRQKNSSQRSRKNSTRGDKAELSSSILPPTSHAHPTSCFFNAVRANVRPQINVMSHWWGKHIDSEGWAGRQMKGDKSGWASRRKRRKDKNVIKDKQEYKKMLEMHSLYLSKKPGIRSKVLLFFSSRRGTRLLTGI